MAHALSFDTVYAYDSSDTGISIPLVIEAGKITLPTLAKLDTGAGVCIFERALGEDLGWNIEAGEPLQVATATGSFLTYGHDVSISAFGFRWECVVYFPYHYGFPRNVLGRRGGLGQLSVGIVDYERKLYVSRYSKRPALLR